MNYIKPEDVQWKRVKIIKDNLSAAPEHTFYHYEFELPEPLASWDVFDYWERERFESMQKHLEKGDILFDIGTEQGWCNLIYAQFVGAENMVLIEPTQEFWGNIKATWQKNGLADPKACLPVLLSDKDTHDYDFRDFKGVWPSIADSDLIDRNKYQYIHDNSEDVPEMKLDDYVERTGIVPDALTMDTEGSELLILKGAEKTLKKHHPKLFVSIHPDLGERDYGVKREDTIAYLEGLGYKGEHLATDHEEHWYFS
jgi:FkbM family methyltransferase